MSTTLFLAETTSVGFNLDVFFLPELGRHTGGHRSFDRSNRTVVDSNHSHCVPPVDIISGNGAKAMNEASFWNRFVSGEACANIDSEPTRGGVA